MFNGSMIKIVSSSARRRKTRLTRTGHTRIAKEINRILQDTVQVYTTTAVLNYGIWTGMAAAELVPLAQEAGYTPLEEMIRHRVPKEEIRASKKKPRYSGAGYTYRTIEAGIEIGEGSFRYNEMQGGDLRRTGASFSFDTHMAHFNHAGGEAALMAATEEAEAHFDSQVSRYLVELETRYADDIAF